MTSSPSASPGAASLDEGGAVGGEIKAQSSSKRQPDANTTVKAVKCNVRAFPEAAGAVEQHAESSEEARQHSGYCCRSMEHSALPTAGDSGGRAPESQAQKRDGGKWKHYRQRASN